MDPQQLGPDCYIKHQHFIPYAKVRYAKNRRGWVPPPIGNLKVKSNNQSIHQVIIPFIHNYIDIINN